VAAIIASYINIAFLQLERERPASSTGPDNKLYYVRGRELFCHDYARSSGSGLGVDVPIASLRRVGQVRRAYTT
jgi:hypothetical protein